MLTATHTGCMMGLGGLTDAEIAVLGEELAPQTVGTFPTLGAQQLAMLFRQYDRETQLKIGAAMIVYGAKTETVSYALQYATTPEFTPEPGRSRVLPTIWGVASTLSGAASVYHGYRRNNSLGWALLWGLLGVAFFPITPAVALAQGFGKPKSKGRGIAGPVGFGPLAIRNRDKFPEILSISSRVDGVQYLVKVPDKKRKSGYDLVTVVIAPNGLRSINSANRSATTPNIASKLVTRYRTQGHSLDGALGLSMRAFIRENREEIDAAIKRTYPAYTPSDREREMWIRNDEGLYRWARSSGVKV